MPANPKAILEKVLELLGFAATIEEHPLEEGLLLDVKADDAGRLIGRQGQTLSDLQYLVNRLLFQQDPHVPKVTVDVSGYRAQARDALVRKAKAAAEKVRRWGDIVELEPMSAFDRRIVHGALKNAWLGQLVTDWIGDEGSLKKLSVQYKGMDVPGDTLVCKGKVTKKHVEKGFHLVECEMWLENSKGEKTTLGMATVSLPSKV